jgi:hypothetical protein
MVSPCCCRGVAGVLRTATQEKDLHTAKTLIGWIQITVMKKGPPLWRRPKGGRFTLPTVGTVPIPANAQP